MPYYLDTYVGDGHGTPFRPRGAEQPGWSAIDLRPDCTRVDGGGLNACLLHLPEPDPRLDLLAVDPAESCGPRLLHRVASRFNLTRLPRDFRSLVATLLLDPPRNGWRALTATASGAYEIWLGGLLWRRAGIAGGSTINENWNCADNLTSLTCQLTWTSVTAGWQLKTNQARIIGVLGSDSWFRADTDLATADHYCEATISTLTFAAGALYLGTIARAISSGSVTGYNFKGTMQVPDYELQKTSGGSDTVLGTFSATPAVNDVIRVTASGSSITGTLNGVDRVGPITDSGISGNLRGGVYGFSNNAGNDGGLDNWTASDVTVAAAFDLIPLLARYP